MKKDIIRTIGGIIFAVLIIPATWLIFVGISELIQFLIKNIHYNSLVIIIVVLVFFLLIIVISISKAKIGGEPMQIIIKELFKRKADKNKDESGPNNQQD